MSDLRNEAARSEGGQQCAERGSKDSIVLALFANYLLSLAIPLHQIWRSGGEVSIDLDGLGILCTLEFPAITQVPLRDALPGRKRTLVDEIRAD